MRDHRCATCVAVYGVKVVNDRVDSLIEMSPAAFAALANWQSALPPAVNDALHDRRMPAYRDHVQVTATLVRGLEHRPAGPDRGQSRTDGDQIVSLMSLRLQIEDDDSLPVQEFTVYAATPLAIESDWRGPLLPGSQRRFRAPRSMRRRRANCVSRGKSPNCACGTATSPLHRRPGIDGADPVRQRWNWWIR